MIIEPVARGTANAYGLAGLTLHRLDATAVMLAMASDHVVRGRAEISRALRAALRAADVTDSLIAIGLKPRYPSTGLGYLHASPPGPAGTPRVPRVLW